MGLLNHVGDVYFGMHNFAEFTLVVALWKLKNLVVYRPRHSDRTEILSVRSVHNKIND